MDMLETLTSFGLCTVAYFAVMILWRPVGIVVRRLCNRIARRQRERRTRTLMTLLVKVDGDRVHPSVQLRGGPLPKHAVLRLEVVDEEGRKRHVARRRVFLGEMNREISLPPFSLTPGTGVEEIASWRWDVAIKVRRRVEERWSEYLTALGGLNAEAEIDRAIV